MQLLFYFLRRKRSFKETAKARYFFILQPYFADPNRKRGREPANLFHADGRSLKNMNFSKYAPSSKQNQLQQSFTTGLCSLSGRRQWQVRCWCWRMWFQLFGKQLLECDDESTQYDCFVLLFVCLHRDGLRVWFAQRSLFIDIVSTCDSNLKTSENKRKLSTELTHCPFLKTPKKNHLVASCCAATIKEILFTRDFENKEPHARWEICSAAQRQSSCPKSSGLG